MKSAMILKSRNQQVTKENCPLNVEKQVQDVWTSCWNSSDFRHNLHFLKVDCTHNLLTSRRNSSDKFSILSRWTTLTLFDILSELFRQNVNFSQGGLPS